MNDINRAILRTAIEQVSTESNCGIESVERMIQRYQDAVIAVSPIAKQFGITPEEVDAIIAVNFAPTAEEKSQMITDALRRIAEARR